MKRLNTLLLAAIILASCEKSAIDNPFSTDQENKTKGIGWHSYSVTISTVYDVNPMCSDLLLNVATDKNAKGKIVLNEYEGPYHRTVLNKWEATNTNDVTMNTGKKDASQRYFDATFTWGGTIITSGKTIDMQSCTK